MYILADAGLSSIGDNPSFAIGMLVVLLVFCLIFGRKELVEGLNEMGDFLFARQGDGLGFDSEPEEESQWIAF